MPKKCEKWTIKSRACVPLNRVNWWRWIKPNSATWCYTKQLLGSSYSANTIKFYDLIRLMHVLKTPYNYLPPFKVLVQNVLPRNVLPRNVHPQNVLPHNVGPPLQNVLSTKRPPIQNVLLYKTSSYTKRPPLQNVLPQNVHRYKTSSYTKRPPIQNVLLYKTSSHTKRPKKQNVHLNRPSQ